MENDQGTKIHILSLKEFPNRFDSINSYLIGFSFVFYILFVFSNTAFAETTFMTNEYKLAHDPTICILEHEDKNIPEIGKKLVKETEYAILDWEAKLKDTTRERNGWNLESKVIKLNEINSYDFSNCDIQIQFKDQPDNEEEKFSTLGLTFLDRKNFLSNSGNLLFTSRSWNGNAANARRKYYLLLV